MTNNNNNTNKENKMIEKLTVALIIGSGIAAVVTVAIAGALVLLSTL